VEGSKAKQNTEAETQEKEEEDKNLMAEVLFSMLK